MLEIPVEKVNVTTLGFSKDAQRASVLFMWHKEKHSKCGNYKRILDMCLNNDMVSEDQVDSTPLVELLRKEGWEALKQKMLGMDRSRSEIMVPL